MRLLLVEDTRDLADAIAVRLDRAGIACDVADTLDAARGFLDVQGYDVIVLDINLPDGLGTTLLNERRAQGDRTPVLMLTAQFSVDDRVSALNLGADDYLVKPFDQRELEARIHALHRREQGPLSEEIAVGTLTYNAAAKSLHRDGAPVPLTRREFALFDMLVRNRGRIMNKERLFEGLFSFDEADVGLNAIELYIARLRKKLSGTGIGIETQRGLGYRLNADD
ncbi:response regulator transcription factor [Puniceibacterium sp. IMCC21224]|uniref:response regulator transcription factor n=1 Tax=Puniceibacterium sp. IMCC21224 TaxID=1618204 RepID=UPI00064DB968|nr:response regulator transcription factor [Puniceibacterium sp. IMCC21224]KMK66187.1 response regulator with CheY-like receiver domain and winged-helix DNA-binding domain [Puniceibacterium sp. IMCC21224]